MTLSGKQINNYLVGALLAHGTTGDIYQARSPEGTQVALKVLHSHLTENGEFQRRFLREIRLTQAVQHPCAVPILDYGYEDDVLFMVTKLIHGPSLQDKMRQTPFSPEEVGVVVQDIAPALHAGHEEGIIHRDIKPGNILYDELEKKYYLADFGFSKRPGIDDTLTEAGIAVGTPYYISPEAITGENLAAQSDIYSFSVMVYELLVGELPFQHDKLYQISMAHIQLPPPRMMIHHSDFPPVIEAVVMKGLAKKPAERQATMLDFARDYALALEQLSPQARRKVYWKNS
ncbi:MAG: serine/threonine protein kinase [Anaerolineae bacterium]|nr:serine/threonine protein kinase [Anaerolineae bacterium]